jgi:hypothetical protein
MNYWLYWNTSGDLRLPKPVLFPLGGLLFSIYICIMNIMPIRQIDHPFIPLCFHWRQRQKLPYFIYKA